MPEGPEIRRAADALATAVVGRTLRHVWFAFAELKACEQQLVGQRIEAIEPRGKALLTRFDNGLTLYSHNQLYGVWRVAETGKRPPTNRVLRVALETADRAILLYSASDISIWPTEKVHEHPFLQRIGPDVLDVTLDEDGVAAQLADRRFAGLRDVNWARCCSTKRSSRASETTCAWKSCGSRSCCRPGARQISTIPSAMR